MRALCLALTLMLAAPSAAQDMDALFREGIEAVLVGEHDRAIAAYEEQDANGKRWQPTSKSVLSLEGGNGMSKLIVLCFGVVALAATSAIADSDRAAIMEELKEWQKQREATLAIAKCWFSESRLDKKQYASTRVMITKDGRVEATSLYSNGKKIDGDTFRTRAIVFNREDVPLIGFQYGRGVSAAFMGGAREERATRRGRLHPSVKDSASWVGILHYQEDRVPDLLIGKALAAVAQFFLNSQLEEDEGVSVRLFVEDEGPTELKQPKGFADIPRARSGDCLSFRF